MQVITRFPPSPTGYLHIGGARTALFNWLYAHKTGGDMVLRIEDTDRARSTQQAVGVILDAMKWLGLTWKKGPFYQTGRFDRYEEILQELLAKNHAYYCFCSQDRLNALRTRQREQGQKPRYDGCCRNLGRKPDTGENAVIRFRNPRDGTVEFDDVVRGHVVFRNDELDDLIIARTDGTPTYNLTVVVDDIDMHVSHVVRGEDHLNNTPRQINIFRALDARLPVFAHVPLILGQDGQRLSKRHGAVSVLEFRKMGILPEALLNYLVRLGWSHGDQEIFNVDEMIELFDIRDINKSPATFDMEKMLWVNQQYIMRSDLSMLGREMARRLNRRGIGLGAGPDIKAVAAVMKERAQTLEEMVDKIAYLYRDIDGYDPDSVKKFINAESAGFLERVGLKLESLERWTRDEINRTIRNAVKEMGIGFAQLAQPLRIAVSGTANTPSIDVTVELVGKPRTLERIDKAVKFFRQRS
ncbi:MAG: glutamate--tRNA ligase [Gammaproteobacteria bacterium]|nr:glutamate--tRNA ligase [Gammaproteobacteria bacterium]